MRSRASPITFTHENVPPALPPDVTLCLFRIVQEALQNALKHGRRAKVSVRLEGGTGAAGSRRSPTTASGFDVDAAWGRGLGLISMDERVEAIGGIDRDSLDSGRRDAPRGHRARGRRRRMPLGAGLARCRFCIAGVRLRVS